MRPGLVLILGFAASPLAAQRDIPANSVNVRTELKESEAGNGDRFIYVINDSSHPIIVTSVRMMECENIQGCSTIRRKTRVGPGARIMVYQVRTRMPDQPSSFRYTFTWEPEAEEGPTAKDVARDPSALVIDTVVVSPMVLDLKVGETVDLGQVLSIKAMNAKGNVFQEVHFRSSVAAGEGIVTLDGRKITGVAAGTAAITISASTTAVGPESPKGAGRILVKVTP